MKIKPSDLGIMRSKIAPLDTAQRREDYRAGRFPRSDRVQDLNKRYRWDLLYLSGIRIGDGVGIRGDVDLYAYMDDTHIDTALRSIVAPL